MIGLVAVTWIEVVELTSDEILVLVVVLMPDIEEDRAFVETSVLFDEKAVFEEEEEAGEEVITQEQAEEIRDGSPEQCETKEGRPVVAVLSAVV